MIKIKQSLTNHQQPHTRKALQKKNLSPAQTYFKIVGARADHSTASYYSHIFIIRSHLISTRSTFLLCTQFGTGDGDQ